VAEVGFVSFFLMTEFSLKKSSVHEFH